MRRLMVGMAATASAAFVLAVPAAAEKTVATKLTLKLTGGPPAHGRVISKEPECRSGRTVKLVMVAPGSGIIDFADHKTNKKGKWVFSSQLQGATAVRAEVKPREIGGLTCAGAVSPAKSFGGFAR